MSLRRTWPIVLMGAAGGALLTVVVLFLVNRCEQSGHQTAEETAPPTPALASDNAPPLHLPEDWTIKHPTGPINGDCTISGTITDTEKTPVAEAMVRLRLLDEPWETANLDKVSITDNDGLFLFDDLPRDRNYQIFAWKEGMATASRSHASCTPDNHLVLEKGCRLSATFVDERGAPLQGVAVHIGGSGLWPARRALSTAQSPLHLHGLEAGYYSILATWNDLSFYMETPIELTPQDAVELEIQLYPVDPIRVTVLDKTSQTIIPGAFVTLTPGTEALLSHSATTGSDGTAVLGGADKKSNVVSVSVNTYIPQTRHQVRPGDTLRFELQKGGRIEGTVQTATGTPIEGAVINVATKSPKLTSDSVHGDEHLFSRHKQFAEHNGWPLAIPLTHQSFLVGPPRLPLPTTTLMAGETTWAPTDTTGAFVIDGLPEDDVSLGATHPEYVVFRRPTVDMSIGKTLQGIPIIMKPGVILELRIVSKPGHPVEDAFVTVFDMDGQTIRTDHRSDDGDVTIRGLPTACRVTVAATGLVPAVHNFAGNYGDTLRRTIRLESADQTLRGKVVTRTGAGLEGYQVEAILDAPGHPQLLSGYSDSDGTFVLKGAGSGSYSVAVKQRGTRLAHATDVTSKQPIHLVVQTPDSESKQSPPASSILFDSHLSDIPTVLDRLPALNAPIKTRTRLSDSGTAANDAPLTTGSRETPQYGQVDDLVVTGPPSGVGTLPVRFVAKGQRTVVSYVEPGSAVYNAGLRKGATVLKIDGERIRGPSMATQKLSGRIGSIIMLDVTQEDGPLSLVVQRVPTR